MQFAVASPASPTSEEIACKSATVTFGNLPNHDCSGPINIPSAKLYAAVPASIDNIHAISSDIGDAGDATANLIVAALIDDVA